MTEIRRAVPNPSEVGAEDRTRRGMTPALGIVPRVIEVLQIQIPAIIGALPCLLLKEILGSGVPRTVFTEGADERVGVVLEGKREGVGVDTWIDRGFK